MQMANSKHIIAVCTTRIQSYDRITFIDGLGTVNDIKFKKYDTFFVPANKKAIIKGNGEFIITKV